MKRNIAILLASAAVLALTCACTDRQPEVQEEESSRMERVSSSPIDPQIIGSWSDGTNGYIFKEDRHVSLPMDLSESAHFNSDGTFTAEGIDIGKDGIEFDGSELNITYTQDEDGEFDQTVILDMKRKDAANKDSFDGVYDIESGAYAEMICENLCIPLDKADLEASIDGGKFKITVNDYCWYETLDGDSLELFSENMQYVDENASSVKYTYKIDGDTLSLTYEDGSEVVLKRTEDK